MRPADQGFLLLMALVLVALSRVPNERCPDCGGPWMLHWPDCKRHKRCDD